MGIRHRLRLEVLTANTNYKLFYQKEGGLHPFVGPGNMRIFKAILIVLIKVKGIVTLPIIHRYKRSCAVNGDIEFLKSLILSETDVNSMNI